MSVKAIDVVGLLVDHVHKSGYQLRAVEDDIYAEKEKRAAAEKDRDHWRAARQDAMQAGELMQAEIETLRQKLTAAEAAVSLQRSGIERLQAFVGKVRSVVDNDCDGQEIDEMIRALEELDAGDSSAVKDSLTPAPEDGQ